MTVVNPLPNGYLVVTLSPREAVMVMDQILDPADFPWQSSEAQMIAMELKSQIKSVLEWIHTQQTDMLKGMIPKHPVPPPHPGAPPPSQGPDEPQYDEE